jgi:uncharacterized protein (DUF433 family)
MKLRNIALHAVVLMLQILSPALFAQKEFEDAHDRITTSFQKASVPSQDQARRAAIADSDAIDFSLAYPESRSRTMPNLDWSQCPAIESVPGKVSGAWVFRGTRMPVQTVFENLEAGLSIEEITEVFDVTPRGGERLYPRQLHRS